MRSAREAQTREVLGELKTKYGVFVNQVTRERGNQKLSGQDVLAARLQSIPPGS